jgi:hypothetical protein
LMIRLHLQLRKVHTCRITLPHTFCAKSSDDWGYLGTSGEDAPDVVTIRLTNPSALFLSVVQQIGGR